MARIRGNRLSLKLGSPAVEYNSDLTSLTLESEEPDEPTFGDLASGVAKWVMRGTTKQDAATGSFWAKVWASAGTDAAYTVAPYGNAEPSASQPHYAGTVTIGRKPSIGGDAGTSDLTFDFEWDVIGEPTPITSGD